MSISWSNLIHTEIHNWSLLSDSTVIHSIQKSLYIPYSQSRFLSWLRAWLVFVPITAASVNVFCFMLPSRSVSFYLPIPEHSVVSYTVLQASTSLLQIIISYTMLQASTSLLQRIISYTVLQPNTSLLQIIITAFLLVNEISEFILSFWRPCPWQPFR